MTTELEQPVQQQIILRASQAGLIMWRNNSGVAREQNRVVRYGLGNTSTKINRVWKSADLIGIGAGGTFIACEVKKPDWKFTGTEREHAQWAMLTQVVSLGGIGFFATSVADYERAVLGIF